MPLHHATMVWSHPGFALQSPLPQCPHFPPATRAQQMWQYVFFIVHLRRTPITDLTGVEAHVASCLRKEDTTWFPLHKVGDSVDGSSCSKPSTFL